MGDEDPWLKARTALRAASEQFLAATASLASVGGALAEAGFVTAKANAKAGWSIIRAGAGTVWSKASEELDRALDGEPLGPIMVMFALALVAQLFICSCCMRLPRMVSVLLIPALAALLAVPGAYESWLWTPLTTSTITAIAAARAHPVAASAIESANQTYTAFATHPHIETVTALACAAHNASATFASLANDAVAANPHARAAYDAVLTSSVLSHHHVAATLEHAHLPTLLRALVTLCVAGMAMSLLRCCCCPRRSTRTASLSQGRGAKGEGDGDKDQHKAKAGKEGKTASGGKAKAKGGSGGAPKRLRGVGEGELRSDEELAGPSTVDMLLAPWRALAHGVSSGASVTYRVVRWLLPGAEQAEAEGGQTKRRGRAAAAATNAIDENEQHGDGRAGADGAGAAPASSSKGSSTRGSGSKGKSSGAEPQFTHPRLLVTLKGFSEGVTSAALSQDGNLAAAVSSDRTLRVFAGLSEAGTTALPPALMAAVKLDHGTACSLSANGRNVIVGTCTARRILAYTITPPGKQQKAGLSLRKEFAQGAHAKPMGAVLLAPNSRFFVTVCSEGGSNRDPDRETKTKTVTLTPTPTPTLILTLTLTLTRRLALRTISPSSFGRPPGSSSRLSRASMQRRQARLSRPIRSFWRWPAPRIKAPTPPLAMCRRATGRSRCMWCSTMEIALSGLVR